MKNAGTVIVRGGGDLATGIVYRLWRVGFSVLVLEAERPLVVRRTVSVASAVFEGSIIIEGMEAVNIASAEDFDPLSGKIQVLVDPEGRSIGKIRPRILVDAVMAKKNLGTTKDMAPLVIAIGPGFSAPEDVHAVIETKRGHTLGRVITKGSALPNTGVPGVIKGFSTERLLRSP
nr:EF2563 family selenium-dependent molybdenum hydroxylase system protein [Synergistes sp.]